VKPYPVPAQETYNETKVSNSRFIAALNTAHTVEEAKNFIARIRNQYPQATHHVPAFLIGYGDSIIAHCSDDGEPSGTSGKPILSVIQGSGLGDAVLVVTRFFGGTKLGTGGLVRAYSEAARKVIENTPRAIKTPTVLLKLIIPYSLFEITASLIRQFSGTIEQKLFETQVTLWIRLEREKNQVFSSALAERTAGNLNQEVIRYEDVLILIK